MRVTPKDSHPPLYSHQDTAVKWCLGRLNSYLSMDMGSGKSRCIVSLRDWLDAPLTLVITTKRAVAHVWPGEFVKWAEQDVEVIPMRTGTVASRIKKANLKLASRGDVPAVVVCNWEMLRSKTFEAWLKQWPWRLIACDEAHKAKSPTGTTSKALTRVMRASSDAFKVMLSGTPMPHSPLDIWAQMRALDVEVFGPRYHAFQSRIAVMGGFPNPRTGRGTVPVAWQNMDWMQEQLRRVMYQPEIELDLPATRHIRVAVDLNAKTRALYDTVEADIVAMIGAGDINPQNGLVKLLRLQQIASGIAVSETMDDWGEVTRTTTTVGQDKADAVLEIIEGTDQPVVVFCVFRAELDAIAGAAAAAGTPCSELSGRRDELAEWLAGDSRVLAVQIAAGSEALDFTRAHHCVFMSTGFNMGQYEQALKRCHRPGQDQPVTYYHVCATDTVDTRVYETLLKRGDLVRAALEGLTQQ